MTTIRTAAGGGPLAPLPPGTVERHGGDRLPGGARIAVVVSRYNEAITEAMLGGAIATLVAAGLSADRLTVARVPGAFELPLAADRIAAGGRHDAVICLGAIIRGETTHDQHIAAAVARGIEQVARTRGVPILFGVLTCGTIEQAIARAGGAAGVPGVGNKGSEAAAAAVEMVCLLRQIAED